MCVLQIRGSVIVKRGGGIQLYEAIKSKNYKGDIYRVVHDLMVGLGLTAKVKPLSD